MNDSASDANHPESHRPAGPVDGNVSWDSDVAAQMLRRLDIPSIALNPGASYRGLHDSLVNHLGDERPGILMGLHEEHAVAIAHGYAKAAGKPLAGPSQRLSTHAIKNFAPQVREAAESISMRLGYRVGAKRYA